jgi:hypothetical protein
MKKIFYRTIICFGFIFPCYADTSTSEDETSMHQSEYLSPDQITEDDYAKLSAYAIEYDTCLNEKSRVEINNFNDPRHVVDTAMKQCAIKLEALNSWMQERKFPPGFTNRYIQKTSSRSVNKLLPAVMMEIAARQSTAE